MLREASLPLLAVMLAACPTKQNGDKPDTGEAIEVGPQTRPPGTADEEGETPSTRAHMQDHFSKADEIKAALIAGKLEQAREPARWMAEHQADVDHPDAWKPYVQSMREAAQRIGGAKDLAAATRAFVELAEVCAACHTALGGPKIDVGEPPKPSESDDLAAHMARHQWALDAMWQGLMGPSKDAWIVGAEALAEAPLAPGALAPDQSVPKEIEQLAARVHALGNEARDVPDVSGIPGRVYAELLTTCETCHAALRR
ncbi:MAG: hypothetical protein R6X02_21465 [Enhygromyxa sp.]